MKKTALVFAFFLLSGAPPAFPKGILWIPSPDGEMAEILKLLDSREGSSLTLAPPAEISDGDARLIKSLASDGKLEIALRLGNDPIPGLFYFPDSDPNTGKKIKAAFDDSLYFFAQRMSDSKNSFSFETPGFSNSPGAANKNYVPIMKSLRMEWIAVGKSTSATTPVEYDGVIFVPFAAAESSASFSGDFLVFDETFMSSRTVRSNLELFLKSGEKAVSVDEELKNTAVKLAGEEEFIAPGMWVTDYSPWTRSKTQTGYLNALSEIRGEILESANSSSIDRIRKALDEFYAVESGEILRLLGKKQNKDLELKLQKEMAEIYMTLGKNLPGWIFNSFSRFSPATGAESPFVVQSRENNISFSKIATKEEKAEITGLSVEWDSGALTFNLARNVSSSTQTRKENEGAYFEIYIDINQRARAGLPRTFPPNPFTFQVQDAWEYAVKAKDGKAVLYYSTIVRYKKITEVPVHGTGLKMSFSLPRDKLRGHPARWGYTVLLKSAGGEVLDIFSASEKKGHISALRVK